MIGNSNEKSSNGSGNNNNVYDIICYYKEENDGENHDNVHDVIEHIEKAKTKHQQQKNDFKEEVFERKKWIKWRLFGCLIMNILLSSPIYSFVTIYLHHKEKLDENIALIWIPIIFNAVYLLSTPWLFNTILSPTSNASSSPNVSRLTNRNVLIIFTLVLSAAISLSGFAFAYLNANFFLILLFYGIIGGMSSCVILGKMFVIINGILNNERLHLINFIYSFAHAVTQFLFPFMIHYVIQRMCYNCSILIIGGLILHIIPISLLVLNKEISIPLNHNEESQKFPIDIKKNDESRYADIAASASYDFYPDIKYPSDVLDMEKEWKNPSNFNEDLERNKDGYDNNDDHFLEILDSHRVMNSDGVEILETIAEIDEEEIKLPEDVVFEEIDEEGNRQDSMDIIYEEINRKHEMHRQQNGSKYCDFIRRFMLQKFEVFFTTLYRQIINPLRRSLVIFRFYPSVILKSIDIFSYLLFVMLILPNQALLQYRFEERENVVYLITLMGCCWIIYSVVVLKFHKSLKQNCIHYFHFIGLLAKFFGYLFTNQRYSFNGFLFGIVLISMGHANSFHLQETVIRNCFHPRKWFYIRGPIYSFSGFLILIYCIVFHILHTYLSFVTFTNIFVLFNLCGIIVWLITNYELLIYVCSRY